MAIIRGWCQVFLSRVASEESSCEATSVGILIARKNKQTWHQPNSVAAHCVVFWTHSQAQRAVLCIYWSTKLLVRIVWSADHDNQTVLGTYVSRLEDITYFFSSKLDAVKPLITDPPKSG